MMVGGNEEVMLVEVDYVNMCCFVGGDDLML